MKKTVLSVAALALLLGYAAVSQTPALPKHHVVFQLSEPDGDAWGSLALHVNNTMKALAENGGSPVEPLKQLSDSGVKLVACGNRFPGHSVDTEYGLLRFPP